MRHACFFYAAQRLYIDSGRSQQCLTQGLAQAHHGRYSSTSSLHRKYFADQRKAVAVYAGRCDTDQGISRLDGCSPVIRSFLSTTPTAKPARSYSSSGISPGCSAVSPPISAAVRLYAALCHTTYDCCDLLRIVLATCNIIKEEQRLPACTGNVVHTHRYGVNTDGIMLIHEEMPASPSFRSHRYRKEAPAPPSL